MSERLFRLLLRLYPREFRERNGAEMVRLFRERMRDVRAREGRWGEMRLWAGTVADTVSTAGREWVDRTNTGGGVDGWMADLRYSFRTLLRKPGFTAVVVLTIALGIGVNTAIFSVVRSVLLRPLPYDEPDEIVLLWGEMRNRDVNHFPSSPPDLRDYREIATSFEHLAGIFTFAQPLTGAEGDPEQLDVAIVTEGFLEALGVQPAVGRGFASPDFAPAPPAPDGGQPAQVTGAILLTHGLWQRRWGGDPSMVGRIVDLGGGPNEIVGVLPAGFRLLLPGTYRLADDPQIFQAGRFDFDNAPRNNVFLRVVGRLAPGVSLEQAEEEMDRIAADFRDLYPIKASSDLHLHVRPLQAELTAPVRPVILALSGAVVLVLLVACANVSNLLLVRASGRRQEMAVRAALGGGRWRLVRQTVMDGVVLAALGGAAGVGLALLGIDLLLALQPGNVPRLEDVAIDLPVLGFTAAAVGVVALLVGLVPARQAARADVADALGERGRGGGDGRTARTRRFMVAAEVAVSLVLLVGAGLLVRSFTALQSVDPGFEPAGLVTAQINLPFGRYQGEDRAEGFERLREELSGIPGVESVTLGGPLPLHGGLANIRWGPEESIQNPELHQQADAHFIGRDYFETMGTRLLAGRTFSDAEHVDAPPVVVIDEILARRAFPEGDPVGKLLFARVISQDMEWHEVVGVVEHQRHHDLARPGVGSAFFTQEYGGSFGGTWALRTAREPASLAPDVRRAVASFDPLLPVAAVEPMQAAVDRATAPTRFALVLMGVFAGMAGLLAAVGLYGVLAHVVRQRTGEIGVRMAFGAPRGGILRLVVGEGMALSAVGVVAGLVGAALLARVMEGMLVGVEPRDPVTFAAVAVLFLAVAALATSIPAWRASRIDPSEALRVE